jgi:hypothetical protein
MTTLGARTTALAAGLGTLHIDLARHPLGPAPDSLSSDGLHGNARAQTVAATETIRGLGAFLRDGPHQPLSCPDFAAVTTSSAVTSLHRREP